MPQKSTTSKAKSGEKPLIQVKKKVGLLEGVKDTLPNARPYWNAVRAKIEELARVYGYDELGVPIIENSVLYQKVWGKTSEFIAEEAYSLKDLDGKTVLLRPEFISSVARAYLEHAFINVPQPLKVYLRGPIFRFVKPQAAFYRQHERYDVHIVGDDKPISDAELMILGWQFLKELGLPSVVHVNTVGCATCKTPFKNALSQYYRSVKRRLCKTCQKTVLKDPVQLLRCTEADCLALRADAPQTVDYICEDCKGHFMKVLEYLDQAEIPYNLNPHFVREVPFYVRTVFFFIQQVAEQSSVGTKDDSFAPDPVYSVIDAPVLGEGGRYDGVIAKLGGDDTAAVHTSFLLDRVVMNLRERGELEKDVPSVDVFVAQLGEQAKKKTFKLLEVLRKEGICVQAFLNKHDLKSQLAVAVKMNARYTVIMGHKEVLDGTILIRDMESGSQEVIDYNKLLKVLKKRLSDS